MKENSEQAVFIYYGVQTPVPVQEMFDEQKKRSELYSYSVTAINLYIIMNTMN
jgi:hypothetical protein